MLNSFAAALCEIIYNVMYNSSLLIFSSSVSMGLCFSPSGKRRARGIQWNLSVLKASMVSQCWYLCQSVILMDTSEENSLGKQTCSGKRITASSWDLISSVESYTSNLEGRGLMPRGNIGRWTRCWASKGVTHVRKVSEMVQKAPGKKELQPCYQGV